MAIPDGNMTIPDGWSLIHTGILDLLKIKLTFENGVQIAIKNTQLIKK